MKKTLLLLFVLIFTLSICLTACGEKDGNDNDSQQPIHTHEYGEWIVTKDATCDENGEKEKICECGEKQMEVISATDIHTEVVDPDIAPTCTETGLTEGKHCSVCGIVILAQNTVPVVDHEYGSKHQVDEGYHWLQCVSCGHKVDKEEHDFDNSGFCTVCDYPMSVTEGIVYELSSDGTYAMVTGYTGTAQKIKIADSYNGVPVTTISDEAFYYGKITSVIIPNSVTTIGDNAFCLCQALESAVIGDGVTTIGYGAFDTCASLTSVVIGQSVTVIPEHMFYGCERLTSVEIPDGVTAIGNRAFSRCTSLASIAIPDGVTAIGIQAFSGCTSLTSIVIPDSVITINGGAFSGCNNLNLNNYENCNYLGNENNPYLVLMETSDNSLTTYTIHSDTKIIAPGAFSGCKELKTIAIPDNVITIGDSAFSGCSSLTSVAISKKVASIGSNAFTTCTKLASIEVDAANEYYQSINGHLYTKDGKTLLQYAIGKTGKEFTVPGSVTTIGYRAFYGCRLESIVIPASVTVIGERAFENCDRFIIVYYTGSQEQWSKITIDHSYSSFFFSAKMYYNYNY